MARIRTIKPEFWTDETIVRLPFQARLLFIGMWNFADDAGALEYSPDRIGLQVLPAEHDCDISGLIDLLVAAGLVDYWVDENGTQAITITNWNKHQKIDNPSRKTIVSEGYRKKNIPSEARIGVARKYGCPPGGSADASCYYCGMPGKVTWWNGSNGKPSRWITISDLEFDHFVSEHSGGSSESENIILACRCCNRGKREFDPHQFFAIKNKPVSPEEKRVLASPIEDSPLEGKGSRIKDQGSKDHKKDIAQNAPEPKFDAQAHLLSLGVDGHVVSEWIALKKRHKSAPTELVIKGMVREAAGARISLSDAMTMQVENGWKGFKAEYALGQQRSGKTQYQINQDATARALFGSSVSAEPRLIEGEVVQ